MQGEVARGRQKFSKAFIGVVNSPMHLAWMGLTILVVSSIAFKAFEHVSVTNALYWSVITSLGVGYGDVTPHHIGGKLDAALLAATTLLFFIPMIIGSIVSRVVVDRNAYTNAEQEETQHALRMIQDHLGIARNVTLEEEADS